MFGFDCEELHNFDLPDSKDKEDNNELSFINQALIDLDVDHSNNIMFQLPVWLSTMCHYKIISFIKCVQNEKKINNTCLILYANEIQLTKKNDKPPPESFYIFLSGGAWVGKSLLVNVVTEYLNITLRYHDQTLSEPWVLTTLSTGKADTGVNGTTLHSMFHLLVKTGNISLAYKKPRDEVLNEMQNKYKYLRFYLQTNIYYW